MKYPKVYIILLNYNGWADTIECLESVLRNDYPNYQVIVVDNNSPNNSMEYLKAWAEGKLDVWVNPNNPLRNLSFPPVSKPIPYVYYTREEAEKGGNPEIEEELKNKIPKDVTSKYPLVFIQSDDNLGFAGGNNIGIRYALVKNDFDSVILLNNDTVIKRDAISILVNARLKFGEQAIYGGRIYYYADPDRLWYDGGEFNEWTSRSKHLNIKKLKSEIKNNSDNIKEVNFITFCYVLIPKFTLDKIGLLDESYFMYVEDLDYSYRAWKSGYKLYHVIKSEIWHKVSASSGEDEVNEFSAYWMMRSRVRFIISRLSYMKKITSISFLIITRPIRFLFFYIKRAKYAINAQIKGLVDGFRK
ncbi:MAG: glycosyltransferase family 2 protein [Sulfurihydrogenibium sp.]|nr:glycosyltransferase family 2 protein [Sulfurihydrogenibium sp.]